MSVSLCLVRHGATAWSLTGQHTGRTDLPLTAQGEAQACGLLALLQHVAFVHVLTSPAIRAQRTCVLAGLGLSARIEPDLAEWDYGDYEGKRSAEIRLARPGWNLFRDGAPGGESPAAIKQRAERLIRAVRRLSGNVALFSHGQFGQALAACWIGLPVVDGQHFHLDTASVSILTDHPAHPEIAIIKSWNLYAGARP
jgi:probable phosphoglycerate mutase